MIVRQSYLDKIKPFIGRPIVKAITGLRRVGKSFFLRQLMALLKEDGVAEENILYIDMEQVKFDFIRDYRDLHRYVEEKSAHLCGKIYVFIDEIQVIEQWERTIASWSGCGERYDCIITGSNSTMFSSELATLLTGRYVEITIYPLSFKEFLLFFPEYTDDEKALEVYLRYGGMPSLRVLEELTDETVVSILSNVQDSIVLKDIVQRKNVRNIGLLEKISRFAYDNIGQALSASGISNYLKNQKINANVQSILNYLEALKETQLFSAPLRYDIKGKRYLDVNEKYYATDLGLRMATIGYRMDDIAQLIENVVYNELCRRYDSVRVGMIDALEVDFIVEKNHIPEYFQVTHSCHDPKTLERETRSLLAIQDNYAKTVITLLPTLGAEHKGIRFMSLRDFLLS